MEGIALLDGRFGVDAFDGGIDSMRKFYDCMRKGPMSYYVTDFENLYEDATINVDMLLSNSATRWHRSKECLCKLSKLRIC